jgi:hypothetical protein
MEIIEQKVRLKSATFVKSEIEEISSFFALGSDGITYVLKPGLVQEIRNSKPMQKAMQACLLDSLDGSVIASLDLRPALELYRK